MRHIQVSEEYLDTICDWMTTWSKKNDSYTIPQFIELRGIGFPYLQQFCCQSDKVRNTYEVMKARLHNRWLGMVMRLEEMPVSKAKVLMRYLRLYDSHALYEEREMKKAVEETRATTEMRICAENYAREELQQPYKGIYEENDNKRRS